LKTEKCDIFMPVSSEIILLVYLLPVYV
jgi:hypothetical protein